jgi:adenylate kinase
VALNLIMLGPPGAGKGTQSSRFAHARGIPKVSTGDILRQAVHDDTEIGRRVKTVMDRGELVNDELMTGIVRERLERPDARQGFILDGFPRTVAQAVMLDEMIDGRGPLLVIDIVVPEAELVRRLSARMICAACGANAGDFSGPAGAGAVAEKVMMPAAAGMAAAEAARSQRCRVCGGPLVQRSDDSDGVVLERLKVYHRQTEPLVEYYRDRPTFRQVNGAQPPDFVAAELARAVDAALGVAISAGGGVAR